MNPVEIYSSPGAPTLLYRFDPMPQNVTFNATKVGNSSIDIPGQIRPWMFDFTSQSRQISISTTLMNLSTRDNAVPGTGSILDQIEDLQYILSCNWNNVSNDHLLLFVPYSLPSTVDLSQYYNSTGNIDYAKDAASIPTGGDVIPTGVGQARSGYDKIYYIYPIDFTVTRDEASVNRVKVSMNFVEIEWSIKI